MASLVNTLKKAVSVQESEALCPKPASSLPASPSFSDFSLCAHTDAADGYEGGNLPQPISTRNSMDESQTTASPRWAYMFGPQAKPRDIAASLQGKPLKSSSSDVAQSLPRGQEGKIGGMSYYDYCDLIRSSSSL